MIYLLFLVSLALPIFHLQFARLTITKREGKFEFWKWSTLSFMWRGNFSMTLIFGIFALLNLFGMDVYLGSLGFMLGVISNILMYELYIQHNS